MEALIELDTLACLSNKIDTPSPNLFKEGQFAVDRLNDFQYSFLYCLRFIDPWSIDFIEKNESEEVVINWPTTRRYTEWFKDGVLPLPVTVIFQQAHHKYMSTNRRRILAAREAGIKKIPDWVEVGRLKDMAPLFSNFKT